MKRSSKSKVISLILAIVMFISSVPFGSIGAFAVDGEAFDILLNGSPVTELVLPQDEKLTLSTSLPESENLSYRWQLQIDQETDEWVSIKGGNKSFCNVSYALVASLLDASGKVALRCKAADGAAEYISTPVTVTVSYEAPAYYEPERSAPQPEPVDEGLFVAFKAMKVQRLMFLSAPPAPEEPTLPGDLSVAQDEKVTLTTSWSGRSGLTYRWQILFKNNVWVNINGGTKEFCDISYALVSSMLDDSGTAYLRCRVTEGDTEYFTNQVAVKVSFTAPMFYEAPQPKLMKAAAAPRLLGAEEDIKRYDITIDYVYENGESAFTPYTAQIAEGAPLHDEVASPNVTGYAPYVLENGEFVKCETFTIDIAAVTEDVNYTVYYRPAMVNYTVQHHMQNLLDDAYTLDPNLTRTMQGLTGSQVADCALEIDGFNPLYYERLTIAADGSTLIDIFYDRAYYLIYFDLDGGYGVEPIYTRYGSAVGVNAPTRPGYIFDGWELTEFGGRAPTAAEKSRYSLNGQQIEVPSANLTYKAKWETADTTYTVVYWKENADDDGYSYWGSKEVGATSGSYVSGSNNVTTNLGADLTADAQHFTYNGALTDKNVLVEGDGSSIVNVYYTRNVYNLYFRGLGGTCQVEEHTHGTDCDKKLICNNSHVHTSDCHREFTCTIPEHTAHTEDCLICGMALHPNHNNCHLICTHGTNHDTTCYENVGDPFSSPVATVYGEKEDGCIGQSYGIGLIPTGRYYIYISGNWYRYRGDLRPDQKADATCGIDVPHTHDENCYDCKLPIHEQHDDTCYSDVIHSHTDACYAYTCGYTHEHTEECYGACTKLEHTHNNQCRNNPIAWVVTAKYEQNIAGVWPTADKFTGVTLQGWRIEGDNGTISVSKRVNMTADLCDTSDRLLYARAEPGGTLQHLYYMFESFDQTNDANGNLRKKWGNKYYDSSSIYRQDVHSSGYNWNQKAIMGMEPVANGVDSDGNDIFLYYNRNRYTLTFHNVNTVVKTVSDVMYEMPMKDLMDGGVPVSSFVPEYPSNYERNAYYFAGWYTTPRCFEGTEYDFATAKMPASNMQLYAKWAPIAHAVNVYKTADKTERLEQQVVDHGDLADAPEEVTNGNYSFAGWFYMDGSEEKAFVFNSMPVNKDLDIYAKWQSKVAVMYEIHYELVDGTPIADPEIGSTMAGNNKTFTAKAGNQLKPAYQEGYFPFVNSHTIVMSADSTASNTFTFVYKAVPNVPYKVRYVYAETGSTIDDLPEVTVNDNRRSVVTEIFKKYPGYMPDAYQKRLVLVAEDPDFEHNVITFRYEEDREHAYYRIVHYIQNLSGDGYTEFVSVDAPGDIDQPCVAEVRNIIGYQYNGNKTKINNVVVPSPGPKVSQNLTADGLLIEMFYDRIDVDYTVRYLEHGTNQRLADSVTKQGKFGEVVTETALEIPGYTRISQQSQNITLRADAGQNVITFYYTENQVTIQYTAVGSGAVSSASEIVKVITGAPSGSAATPNAGYRLAGWYLDADCTRSVPDTWVTGGKLVPQKEDGFYQAATYYAKFEPDITELTITKKGAEAIDEDQTFLFRITDNGVDLTVTIHGNSSITVSGLTVGKSYTVTELTDWSWRYDCQGNGKTVTLQADPKDNVLTFENERTNPCWLDGNAYEVNVFTGNTAE